MTFFGGICKNTQNGATAVSATISDTILLDQTLPTGELLINGGAVETGQPAVTLTLAAEDEVSGVCEMQIRNLGQAWSDWQPFAPTAPWTLESGMGIRWVEARVRDCAGNESETVSASIWLGHKLYLPVIIK